MSLSSDFPEIENTEALITSPEIQRLFSYAAESALTRDDLADIRLPLGMSLHETEDLISDICQLFAIWYPVINEDHIHYWYYPTRKLYRLLRQIDYKSSPTSSSAQALETASGPRLIARSMRTAAVTSCHLLGICIDPDRQEILLHGNHPQNDDEQLLMNTYNLLYDVPALAKEPLSAELFDTIYLRLAEGVSSCASLQDLPQTFQGKPKAEQINAIIDLALNQESRLHPLLDMIPFTWTIEFMGTYGKCSALVSEIFFRQQAVRAGLPVLRLLTPSTVANPNLVTMQFRDKKAELFQFHNGDMTNILTAELSNMNQALDDLDADFKEVFKKEDDARILLRKDDSLNHRQCSILERALRVSDSEFHIGYHRATHGIAYSTARADLFGLVDAGYLEVRQEGKTFVFTAVDDLADKLEALAESDS